MGFVFARRGIVPETLSSYFLPRLVGVSTALEWTMTGRVFTSEEAHERGLVRSLHAPDELLPAAHALAREIADNTAPVSVALARRMMLDMLDAGHPMEAHRLESRLDGGARAGGRCEGRRDVVPGETCAGLSGQSVDGHAAAVSVAPTPFRDRWARARSFCETSRAFSAGTG